MKGDIFDYIYTFYDDSIVSEATKYQIIIFSGPFEKDCEATSPRSKKASNDFRSRKN